MLRIGLLLAAAPWIPSAGAEERGSPVLEITYDDALALARERAPALTAARARIGEAESELEAASVWPFNPEVAASAGPRDAPDGTITDWWVGVEQRFELGGRRDLRRRAARAGITAASARTDDARRRLVRDVSLAFVSALYWGRRVSLAEENVRLAEGVARIAKRRHEVGDVGGLDESVSALAELRARSDVDRSEAALTAALSRLKSLLGIEAATEITCRGDLRELGIPDASPNLDDRPDLRALRAEIDRSAAEADLGRRKRIPEIAVGAGVGREESTDVAEASLTIALPIFDRGQGDTAIAEARRERLRLELDAAESAASVEARSAREIARRLTAAALRFERRGPSTLDRAERLARGSYEAGAIPLGELLAVRRELMQARLDYVELLYGAAKARVELSSTTGALR